MAVTARGGNRRHTIFHSDRGSQGGFNWSSQHFDVEVCGGKTCGLDARVDGVVGYEIVGSAVASPREATRVLVEIAKGITTEQAAAAVGVSQAVGARWFRHAGGMSSLDLAAFSGRYLSFVEREEVVILNAAGVSAHGIVRRLGRSGSTVSRELRRNAATRGGKLEYRASVAQWKAELVAQRRKVPKMVVNDRLRDHVRQRLAGEVLDTGGKVTGPLGPVWPGRNKPHRGDRRWFQGWSPEQISNRLKIDFPDEGSMRISDEAIYQALYIAGCGGLEWYQVARLRTGRVLRVQRKRQKTWAHVTPGSLLSERPDHVEDRKILGHWEGDLIIGLKRSAAGTIVERTSRFTLLTREKGFGEIAPTNNSKPLAGYGAKSMRKTLVQTMSPLPERLRCSLTRGRGKELSDQATFTAETGPPAFSLTRKARSNEARTRTPNGLLLNYFPKGTDLSRWNADELKLVAYTLNNRPRKILD